MVHIALWKHHNDLLTPKGLNVRTADKPVLVCVTWAHTIFRFFETFFEHASHSKLCGSKVMDVWSFKEKSGQGGHVLQPMRKSWPLAQKVEGRKKKKFKKNGNSPTGPDVNPRPAGDCWSLAGSGSPGSRRPAVRTWSPDRRSSGSRRPEVAAWRSAAQSRPATSGRPPAVGWHQDLSGCPNFFEIFIF
jgi:hypothetical protein